MTKRTVVLFLLALALSFSGLRADDQEQSWEARLEMARQRLLENGASSNVVEKLLGDMAVKRRMIAGEKWELAEDPWGDVQGVEGAANTFYGYLAGSSITSGIDNCFFGRSAGKSNTSGWYNTLVGHKAGLNNLTGWDNTFVGYQSGLKNTRDNNTFIGSQTGFLNISGDDNTFVGMRAGYANTSGWGNTIVGAWSGDIYCDGSQNTYIGTTIGRWNQSGIRNTSLGYAAGYDNLGSGNVFIGCEAGFRETGSNKLYIDNFDTTTPLIYGDFAANRVGINNAAPGYMLVVGTGGARCNGTTWIDGSSREVKENVEALSAGEAMQAVAGLEAVKFNYKDDKGEQCLGFIAEEVPELVSMNDRRGLSPMDIVAVLTKALQEQQRELKELRKEIELIRAQSQK